MFKKTGILRSEDKHGTEQTLQVFCYYLGAMALQEQSNVVRIENQRVWRSVEQHCSMEDLLQRKG